jgi:aminodeoxyfutalosine deaminase
MNIRKISASYVFTLTGSALKNGIVVVDEKGIIVDIIDTEGNIGESEGLEHYAGIICPGFVNAHCHLELSGLKGKIEPALKLPGFLKEIFFQRNQHKELQELAIRQADRYMFLNGIVAVGDISNSTITLETKEKSPIYYHTFIECFGFMPEKAPRAFEYAQFVSYLFDSSKLPYSIVPHSVYSTSTELWDLIIRNITTPNGVQSVHHAESDEEELMLKHKKGALLKHYTDHLKMDITNWNPPNIGSTRFIINNFAPEQSLMLVHNTYLTNENIIELAKGRNKLNTFLVTCPKSNLFIERKLPDYSLWKKLGFPICIGTDSLASNNSLSILEEMKTISQFNPENICLEDLLQWACINGAKALKIDDKFGTIEIGKKPGLNLITSLDLKKLSLTGKSRVKKLV